MLRTGRARYRRYFTTQLSERSAMYVQVLVTCTLCGPPSGTDLLRAARADAHRAASLLRLARPGIIEP